MESEGETLDKSGMSYTHYKRDIQILHAKSIYSIQKEIQSLLPLE